MKGSDVGILVKYISAFDRREIDDAHVESWVDALEKHSFRLQDAKRAVADHFGQSHEYLTPKHVIDRVIEIGNARVMLQRGEQAALEAGARKEIQADDLDPRTRSLLEGFAEATSMDRVLDEPGSGPTERDLADPEMPPTAVALLAELHNVSPEFVLQRRRALGETCETCGAGQSRVCFSPRSGQKLTTAPAHQARLVKAGVLTSVSELDRLEGIRRFEEHIGMRPAGGAS